MYLGHPMTTTKFYCSDQCASAFRDETRAEPIINFTNLKVLIGEFFAVDGLSAGSIASREITTLDHEVFDDAMEFTSGVTAKFASRWRLFTVTLKRNPLRRFRYLKTQSREFSVIHRRLIGSLMISFDITCEN